MNGIHAVAASSDAAGFQPDEGGSQPTLLLQLLPAEDFRQTRLTIRPVSFETASAWFGRWHYLGDAPPACTYWGLFAPDLGAVVSIGLPNNASGIVGKFDLDQWPGNIEVSRVAVHPDMPGPTSRLMWLAIKADCAVRRTSWVYSYADTGRGHHGGIYQALGAVYVGLTASEAGYVNGAGDRLHPRTAVSIFGSRAIGVMEAHGYQKVAGLVTAKHTYVMPVGPDAPAIRDHLRRYSKPYPKRLVPLREKDRRRKAAANAGKVSS